MLMQMAGVAIVVGAISVSMPHAMKAPERIGNPQKPVVLAQYPYYFAPPPGWGAPRGPMPMGPPQGYRPLPRYYDDGAGMGYRPFAPYQYRNMDPYLFRYPPPYPPGGPYGGPPPFFR